jgi:hypothetical protein
MFVTPYLINHGCYFIFHNKTQIISGSEFCGSVRRWMKNIGLEERFSEYVGKRRGRP